MKTLKSIIIALALVIVCGVAKAAKTIDNDEGSLLKNYAINTYIDAITHGRLNGFNEVLDATVKFSMLRGKQVISFSKNDMMDYLNANQNIELTCTTNTEIVESDANISVVKVDMRFDGFVRSNYVTMANTGNGWKITNVYSVFK
jgi:hypothetical protein